MKATKIIIFSALLGFGLMARPAQGQSYLFEGKLVYELAGTPGGLPVPGASKVEILYHLMKPLLAITYVEEAKRTTYLYDGTNKLTAVLYEEGEERTARLDREPEVDLKAAFQMQNWGAQTAFTETGDRRNLHGRMCKEYVVETETSWTKAWMEPNFTVKGRDLVFSQFFRLYHLSGDEHPFPFGFPFSVSTGNAGETEAVFRADLVERELKQYRINPGAYRLLGAE